MSNYLKLDYHQLEGNNVLSFAKQGGVYHTKNEVFYKNINKDFNNAKIRAEYYFPPLSIKEKYFAFRSRIFRKSLIYLAKRAKQFVILLKKIYRSIRNRLKFIKF